MKWIKPELDKGKRHQGNIIVQLSTINFYFKRRVKHFQYQQSWKQCLINDMLNLANFRQKTNAARKDEITLLGEWHDAERFLLDPEHWRLAM